MSFDKSGKNTGTRRKARECALQMLFAVDVVGTSEFSASRYWAELGFDEIHRGAGSLALELRDEIDKLALLADQIRTWLKKADPLERSKKRTEWIRGLTVSVEALRRSFTDFISNLVAERPAATDQFSERASRVGEELQKLIAELEAKILSKPSHVLPEERAQFSEFRTHGTQTVAKIRDEGITTFAKMTGTVNAARPFANRLVTGTLDNLTTIDDRIRTRAEHWRIERMAIVDRNVLRLAVYEFLFEDTPHTVVINEALEIARRFSTFEATQFINGILDAIKLDLEKAAGEPESKQKSQSSSS